MSGELKARGLLQFGERECRNRQEKAITECMTRDLD
jgi:hypothetical protein